MVTYVNSSGLLGKQLSLHTVIYIIYMCNAGGAALSPRFGLQFHTKIILLQNSKLSDNWY